ncbi:MAG TPA: oligosaccharide flippase family protein [Marmoricola sp.]|nr:oligosaccharide flippase family protein [Marmoricola sp.]
MSGLARAFGFLPQGIATLLASHLILEHYGKHAFDTYALIVSVMALIPLNNLGVGASITQAVSAHGPEDERAVGAALTAARVLSVSALSLAVVSTALGMLDVWPKLLGDQAGSNAFTAAGIIVYAVSFVPGLAQSVLLATGRNHISLIVLSFQAPVGLVAVALLIGFHADARWVILVPALSVLAINLFTMALSEWQVKFPWGRILRQVPFRDRYRGAKILNLSGPMLVTSLCVPIAFTSDRIVLSHVSTASAVANYSVVLQIFSPVMGLIVAIAQPLWPMFTKARSQGERGPGLGLIFGGFIGGTLVMCTALVLISDRLGQFIGSDIHLGYFLPTMIALVMVVLAVAYPLAMSMVDPAGARFAAICAVITVPVNITASIFLARRYGAPGPLMALFVVSLAIQVIPSLIFVNRRERASEGVQLELDGPLGSPERLGVPGHPEPAMAAMAPALPVVDRPVVARPTRQKPVRQKPGRHRA